MKNNIFYLRTDLGTQDLKAGGSVAHTLGVLEGFLNQNYTVTCASSAMIDILKKFLTTHFTVLRVPAWTKLFGFKIQCLISNMVFFWQTVCLCDAQQTAFIYQRYSLLNCVGVMLSWWKNLPLILEFNGSEVWVEQHWSQARIKMRFLVRWFERINIKHAHTIVVVSQPLKDQLCAQGVPAEKILVNPNGVNAEQFNPAVLHNQRTEIRARLGLEDAFVFGFAGTFSFWHGINVLEVMIPEVVCQCPQAKFLLIGSGPLLANLKKVVEQAGIAHDRVLFLGMVPQDQACAYLAACDAFISPTQPNPDGSPFFGSPTKLFEYMSLAKPIIASDLATIAQILQPCVRYKQQASTLVQNSVGILIDPNDHVGFIQSACALVQSYNAAQRECMGNNARTCVMQQYTWQHHVHNIVTFVAAQKSLN